jgi:DNA-directed RNA polymerase subunit N (RpoN/RPB10)
MANVLCSSCSGEIGCYILAITKIKERYYEKLVNEHPDFKDYDPKKLNMTQKTTPPLGDLFDAFGIDMWCCRRMLLGNSPHDEQ